jgi:hypothetical protein
VNPTPEKKAPEKKGSRADRPAAPEGSRSSGGLVALVGIGPGDEGR